MPIELSSSQGELPLDRDNNPDPTPRSRRSYADRDAAWRRLQKNTHRLLATAISRERDALFITGAIELSNLSFVLGKGFSKLTETLEQALPAAQRLGDRRSLALINLHLGRLFYFAEKRDKAMAVFEVGISEAESLGDEDILNQASEFIGLYYFIQGRFQEALGHFERAAHSFESGNTGGISNPSGPLWLSYCAAFLGQFHRAIGTLDYYRRVAMEGGDTKLANTLRAVLGIILLGIKKNGQAHFHLSGALEEAQSTRNTLAAYFAKGGLAFHHYLEGRLEQARDLISEATEEALTEGLIRQYASPMVLEILSAIHRKGLSSSRHLNYPDEFKRIMHEPNIHLIGVLLRLDALEQMDRFMPVQTIESKLTQSESHLAKSGDPIQTGKTRIELARLKLKKGDREEARVLAEKARKDFSGYVDVFFPDDLRPLLAVQGDLGHDMASEDQLLNLFSDLMTELPATMDLDDVLTNTVRVSNRYFGAERGGVFWFLRKGQGRGFRLRGPCNLSQRDVNAYEFRENLSLVLKAFKTHQPQVLQRPADGLNPNMAKSMICVPFDVGSQVRGVLYHDNTYVQDGFDNFSQARLIRVTRWLTRYIDHIYHFLSRMEQENVSHLDRSDRAEASPIISRNPAMLKTLDQMDRIADTNSTVLILGETGVGKELLAQRIHRKSRRESRPLVIVDPTVIPETLVESELFGHEKGAFTGADRQKKGLMELAHKGTLFIDEVGEIPRSVQAKLLRVIQEKTLTRIGGTRTLFSDFRLVAATNRDLAAEVAAGRFREDLYYRLNVIPVTLPPLRERGQDIVLLANHFLRLFVHKHKHPGLSLSPDDEADLKAYSWPGNIRELRNVMERAVLLATNSRLHLDLPARHTPSSASEFDDLPTLEDLQRRYISHVLARTNGKISGPDGAAEVLGMKRTSLYNRMNKLGLR